MLMFEEGVDSGYMKKNGQKRFWCSSTWVVSTGVLLIHLMCVNCSSSTERNVARDSIANISIGRLDILQSTYVLSGDYSALQQMSLLYPTETRTLVEDVLRLGHVTDRDINTTFLQFYQDSVTLRFVQDSENAFSDVSDLEKQLRSSFNRLHDMLPDLPVPSFYAQIGALRESIVVNDTKIGISLEKYLGYDYPLYIRFFSSPQRMLMQRSQIVPDCLVFYLLSRYGLSNFESRDQWERDMHFAKIQWVVNRCFDTPLFHSQYINKVDDYMKRHRRTQVVSLLNEDLIIDR